MESVYTKFYQDDPFLVLLIRTVILPVSMLHLQLLLHLPEHDKNRHKGQYSL